MSKEENNMLELTNLIKTVWLNRKIIYLSIAIIVLIGGVWTMAAQKEYKAVTKMLSDSGARNNKLNRYSSLASLAGINLPNNSSDGDISPASYSEILSSLPFQRELLNTNIYSKRLGGNTNLQEYLIVLKDNNWQLKIQKYTLKLPSTILRNFKTKKIADPNSEITIQDVLSLSTEESQAISQLKNVLTLDIDQNTGAIALEVILPEPVPAAQLAKNAQEILEKLIRQYKTKKTENQLEFLVGLHEQKKIEFDNAKNALAEYQDANRIISNSKGFSQLQVLQDQYNLAFSIYNQLSSQLEAKKIEVQENTPVFSVIQPSIVPKSKIGPNHFKSIIVALFLGLFVGLMLVFLKELKLYITSRW
ncbi:Wzz/FepE/Etk N-terminal domain-containing protein [Roseivirga sp.]|uniref:Wzz/FepE/Etk N-terminal domain-containing protein n=1 Tax=Roseivirga sp. TaxID=1964215 RepID=UPI003B8B0301